MGGRLRDLAVAVAYGQKSRLQCAAAQVLNAALQGFKEATSAEFLPDDPGVRAASEVLGVSADTFAEQANQLLQRHPTSSFHPTSIQELDEEVADVRRMITPVLKQLAKWECLFIERYEDIKAAFPTYLHPSAGP